MLPARHRLRRGEDFASAVRGGRSGSRLAVVHARVSQPTVPECRVGFVVSKAVGNSVQRNKVKRRMRAVMAQLLPTLPAGIDFVIRANPAAAGATYSELDSELRRLIRAACAKPGVTP